MGVTFEAARQIVEQAWPDYKVAADGYDNDGHWLLLLEPLTAGGRIPAVSKATGEITWINENSPLYTEELPVGGQAQNASALMNFREYVRDSKGQFSSGGGGVRDSLANAKSIGELNDAIAGEAKNITGRDIAVDMTGSDLQIAREHGEAILQGFERYPKADVRQIITYGPGGARPDSFDDPSSRSAYAVAGIAPTKPGGVYYVHTIGFNTKHAGDAKAYRESLTHGERGGWTVAGGPASTAHHEFGHVVTRQTQSATAARQAAVDHARAGGERPSTAIRRSVSEYAATNPGELAAEAFADVMVHGSDASELSRTVASVIDSRYQTSFGPLGGGA